MSAVAVPRPLPQVKKKVLLVHAVGAHRKLRASVMRLQGFEVICAGDCEEARQLWHPGSYDLVLLDGKHDVVANQELCREMRGASPEGKIAFLVGRPAFLASQPEANGGNGVENTSQGYQHAFRALITEASELLPHRHGFMEAVWRMRMVRFATPPAAAGTERSLPVIAVTTMAEAAPEPRVSFGDAIRQFEMEAEAKDTEEDASPSGE